MAREREAATGWSLQQARTASAGPSTTAASNAAKTPAVELRGLTVRYKNHVALDNVDFNIREGEFFSLLGPSGCGKTTTLNVIGGFVEANEGEVLIEGRPVTRMPAYRRPVNTVFQSYALFPHMSVEENVGFGLRMAGVARAEIRKRAAEALALVSLLDRGDRRPDQLSGGQQQRVALARALVNRPSVLLLDEPLGALDLKLRRQMQWELTRIQREVGITFIYVTHDQEEAMTMSDRIAVMSHGRVAQIGTPQEIYDRPANLFVADFVGTSNVLKGKVVESARDWTTVLLSLGVQVRVPRNRNKERSGEVSVVVRPGHMKLALDSAAPPETNVIPGTIANVAYLGMHLQVTVATERGVEISVVDPLSPDHRERVSPALGSPVHVTWPAALSLCFDDEDA